MVHAEHLGADTNLYLDCEKAGLITVRIFGVYDAEPGATLYATPDPAKTYRFGADGEGAEVDAGADALSASRPSARGVVGASARSYGEGRRSRLAVLPDDSRVRFAEPAAPALCPTAPRAAGDDGRGGKRS